ncbi:MAG: pantetheine-phosphate adenylyltransferase [bacterium]|nr:pantetheine-phosphate adenylyltransferase [bacterium]
MLTAVYAGTFDPVTHGHLDIIRRAAALYERLIVAIPGESAKQPLFSLERRLELLRAELDGQSGIEVASFEGLLVDYARNAGARLLLRGLRASSDFEYEFQMALMNRALAPDIETVFMITRPEYMFISSSLIREVARSGGDITKFVPERVRTAIIGELGQ